MGLRTGHGLPEGLQCLPLPAVFRVVESQHALLCANFALHLFQHRELRRDGRGGRGRIQGCQGQGKRQQCSEGWAEAAGQAPHQGVEAGGLRARSLRSELLQQSAVWLRQLSCSLSSWTRLCGLPKVRLE